MRPKSRAAASLIKSTTPWRSLSRRCESPREQSYCSERGTAKMSLPNQSDRGSQGQPHGTRSGGRIGQPNRARAAPGAALLSDRRVTASRLLRLRRSCAAHAGVTAPPNGCNTVSAGAVETGNGVTNEKADSLGSAVLVGACGAFVAVLRNHAKIVRADADRESPKPPTRSFPVRSHSLGRCRHGGLPPSGGWCTQTVLKA
jgi:hypothetical protein